MFIAELYRHPEARVVICTHNAADHLWITRALRRLLPDGHPLRPAATRTNDADWDIIIGTSMVYLGANPYINLHIRKCFGGEAHPYALELPWDLAPRDYPERELNPQWKPRIIGFVPMHDAEGRLA